MISRCTFITFIGLFLISLVHVFAQPGQLNWIKTFGGPNYDLVENHVVDHEENVIVVGTFHGTIMLDGKSYTSKGESDIILFKSNKHGEVQWAHTLGGSHYHGDSGVDVDAEGNIYLAGGFVQDLYFNTELKLTSTSTYWNSFLAKLSPDGEIMWIKGILGNEVRVWGCIAVNDAGEIALGGVFHQSVIIDDTEITDPPGNPGNSIFYARLTTHGNLVWLTKQLSDTFSMLNDLYIDNTGFVFSTGFFTTKIYFGEQTITAANNSHSDIFIAKFDATGQPIWAKGGIKTTSAELNNEGRSITIDKQTGDVYVIGNFKGNVQFDSFVINGVNTNESSADIFLVKLSSSGEVIWAKREGTAGSDSGNSIKLTGDDTFIISGSWGAKPFVSLFHTDGVFLDQISFSTFGLALTADFYSVDNIFLSGAYLSPFQTSFGTEPHRGNLDGFILNLKQCATESEFPVKPVLIVKCSSVAVSNHSEQYSIQWFVNNQLMGNETQPEIGLQNNATYKAVFSNACGATESDEVNTSFTKPEIYNIITPNQDEFNEFYELHETLLGASLFVFNRWGELVYSNPHYNNTWNGGNLSSGVYYYMISHECYGKFVGPLTIAR
jgi:gliding motility-associated-like protein